MTTPASRLHRFAVVVALAVAASATASASEVSGPGVLAIVAPASLDAAATAWASYRQADGWSVARIAVDDGAQPDALRDELRAVLDVPLAAAVGARRAVLLLGDDDTIPPFRYAQRDAQLMSRADDAYISDHAYRCRDDGRIAYELGRIPARSNDEARAVLEKIRRYEAAPGGTWRRRVAYVAGEGRFGAADHLLEWLFTHMLDQFIPAGYDLSMLYAKADSIYCPPPGALADEALRAFGQDALLVNYVGHGSARAFDALYLPGRRERILDVQDLERLPAPTPGRPIAVLTCCSAGWFDLPDGQPSMAEAMILHPAGPVAVLAGSRITHPYANAILQKDVTHELLVSRTPSVGQFDVAVKQSMLQRDAVDAELDLIAGPMALLGRWPSSLDQLRAMHVRLYNLFGDPATRIALPPEAGIALRRRGAVIEGVVSGMDRGIIAISVETGRTELACPPCLLEDGDLDARLAHNFAVANERVLQRVETAVTAGAFRAELPDGWPARAAIIKAHAVGRDEAGRGLEATGVMTGRRRGAP